MKKHTFLSRLLALFALLTLSACALPGLDTAGTPQAALITPTSPAASLPLVITATSPSQAATAAPRAGATATRPQAAQTGLASTTYTLSGSPEVPAGIFPQISIFQIGGGSGSATPPDCGTPAGGLSWCHPLKGAALSLPNDFTGQACGFGKGPLSAIVTFPDGSTRPANTNGEPPLCRNIIFSPRPNDPPGLYQVTVIQGTSRLSDSFTLSQPNAPAAKLYNSCIWLTGLRAGLTVPIMAFGLVIPGPNDPIIDPSLATWRFLGEGSFSTGTGQALLVCPDTSITDRYPEMAYLAYPPPGKPIPAGDPDLLQQFQGNCANGPKSRLAAGKNARVITKELPLFSDPSLNTKSEVILHQGDVLSVLNGPACPAQGPWTWQVKTQAGQTGWLAESDTTTYFLEPVLN